jgi:DNA polymerase III alpha subunit (gram-positive type)
MNKTLIFIDTETSGLVAGRHTILQIAWVIERNGVILCEKTFDLKPSPDADLCLAALSVNNFTLERMQSACDPVWVLEQLREDVKKAVGGKGALIPCGHRVSFDIDMLHALAVKHNAHWWLNFGNNDYVLIRKPLCTLAMCHFLDSEGILHYTDYKLTTVCKELGVPLTEAHDALGDVQATCKVYHLLKAKIYSLGSGLL